MMERLYQHSPVPLQNLMLSGSALLRWWRRSAPGGTDRAVEELLRWEGLTREEVMQRQGAALSAVLEHAGRSVPYYRELFRHTRISPRSINSQRRLSSVPTLHKDTVLAAPRAFRSAAVRASCSVVLGEAAGTPLVLACDGHALRFDYAHRARLRARLGVGAREPCASFSGCAFAEPWRQRPPFWRHERVSNTVMYSNCHLAPLHMDAYLEHLMQQPPAIMEGYPSALALVAAHVIERRVTTLRPRAVLTCCEPLLPAQRALMGRAFAAPVTDCYGSADLLAFIARCGHGRHHAWPGYGIAEVLVDDRPARPGEHGELVCTSLINRAMPLIRYRTGEMAVAGDGCGCGLPFPVIERIEGRLEDALVTPDGRRIADLDPLFTGLEEAAFREAQLIQTATSRVRLRYVPGERFSDLAVQRVKNELHKRLGQGVQVEVEVMSALPRTAGGRLPTVVGLAQGA